MDLSFVDVAATLKKAVANMLILSWLVFIINLCFESPVKSNLLFTIGFTKINCKNIFGKNGFS